MQDVSRLHNRKDMFPDVIMQYQGQDIYAHKAILALGSPKFQEMFNNEYDEAPTRQDDLPVYRLDRHIKELQYHDVARVVKVRAQ